MYIHSDHSLRRLGREEWIVSQTWGDCTPDTCLTWGVLGRVRRWWGWSHSRPGWREHWTNTASPPQTPAGSTSEADTTLSLTKDSTFILRCTYIHWLAWWAVSYLEIFKDTTSYVECHRLALEQYYIVNLPCQCQYGSLKYQYLSNYPILNA